MPLELSLLGLGLVLAVAGAFTAAGWPLTIVGLVCVAVALLLQDRRL